MGGSIRGYWRGDGRHQFGRSSRSMGRPGGWEHGRTMFKKTQNGVVRRRKIGSKWGRNKGLSSLKASQCGCKCKRLSRILGSVGVVTLVLFIMSASLVCDASQRLDSQALCC